MAHRGQPREVGCEPSCLCVEYDEDEYFASPTSTVREYVTASEALTNIKNNNLAYYSHQIMSMTNDTEYFVRVSAYNGDASGFGGYSAQSAGWPINSTTCDTYPTHCGNTASDQLLHYVMNASVRLAGVANRLEVSWTQPWYDERGFDTNSNSPHEPDMATHYRIEWSTSADYSNSTYYDMRTIYGDGNNLTCYQSTLQENPCNFTVGLSVQEVTVQGTSNPLSGGTFQLVYIGKQRRSLF